MLLNLQATASRAGPETCGLATVAVVELNLMSRGPMVSGKTHVEEKCY